jgi:hypothetical protein
MVVPDENLRNGTPARQTHHAITFGIGQINANFFYVFHAARLEDLFGPNAVRANSGGVHLDR